MPDAPTPGEAKQPRATSQRFLQVAVAALAAMGAYVLVAYLLLPALWGVYAKRHPALEHLPDITYTHDHHPGDPINLALIGSEAQLKAILHAAGWFPADPLGWRSDLKIAADTVLERPYADAPVSNLYLWNRKEDFAFEQPVGDNPRERHHVRFWKSTELDAARRPLWAGAATFDRRVGFSHTTGQITHHIAADIDTERDHVVQSLEQTGELSLSELVPDFHKIREGRNGGGDPWHTDGSLFVGTIGP
jgi:hypothetical protein